MEKKLKQKSKTQARIVGRKREKSHNYAKENKIYFPSDSFNLNETECENDNWCIFFLNLTFKMFLFHEFSIVFQCFRLETINCYNEDELLVLSACDWTTAEPITVALTQLFLSNRVSTTYAFDQQTLHVFPVS